MREYVTNIFVAQNDPDKFGKDLHEAKKEVKEKVEKEGMGSPVFETYYQVIPAAINGGLMYTALVDVYLEKPPQGSINWMRLEHGLKPI